MKLFDWFPKKSVRPSNRTAKSSRSRLEVETLESRIVPYAVSGDAWVNPQLITVSFVPDGTIIDGVASNLQATLNAKFGSPAVWQNVFKKAVQAWAEQTNINFTFVSDDGEPDAAGSYEQGNPNFGDIRIAGYNMNDQTILAWADMPPPVNNYSIAGDITMNTGQVFNIGSTFDLFTVASHEIGHALGLYHGAVGSVMSATYPGAMPGLTTDDINGIRNIYSANLPRAQDAYDAVASDDTFATAVDVSSLINGASESGLIANMDLSTRTDVDWYKITVPAGSTTTLTARAVATGLSLLDPKIDIYNSSDVLKATNNAGAWGATASASTTGIAGGQVWYIKVSSTDSTGQFKTGKYDLVINMGTGADPAVPLPNTQVSNGNPLHAGGGEALSYSAETIVNTYTTGAQTTTGSKSAIAVDGAGDYVVVWASQGQDASNSWGVYGQRFNSAGVPQGSEFRVNTTVVGDQSSPSVAMDADGDFVVSWASYNQDATNSWGVYAQRFNSRGVAQGNEFKVNTTSAGDQTTPSIAMDADGDFVVSWASFGQDASGTWGVYAQRFNNAGVAKGSEFRVNSTTVGDQSDPSTIMGADGAFIVLWSADSSTSNSWDVYAQRYNAAGAAQGSEFRINAVTAGDQDDAVGAIAANGTFVAVWSSSGQDGSGKGVYTQRYDASGALLGVATLVNSTTSGDQTDPSVTSDGSGGFVVTWASNGQDGSGWGIYAQQFGSSGAPLGEEFGVNTTTDGDQVAPAVALDAQGHLTVVWSGNGPGDTSGVFSQRYSVSTDFFTVAVVKPTEPTTEPTTGPTIGSRPDAGGSRFAPMSANSWDPWSGSDFQAARSAADYGPSAVDSMTARDAIFTHGNNKSETFSFDPSDSPNDTNADDDFFAKLGSNLGDEVGSFGIRQGTS
jgi:hypothetical protein